MCTFRNFNSSAIRTRIVHWIWRGFTESDEGSLNLTRVHWISRGFEHLKSRFCGNLTRWKLKQVIIGKHEETINTDILSLDPYSPLNIKHSNFYCCCWCWCLLSSIKSVQVQKRWSSLYILQNFQLTWIWLYSYDTRTRQGKVNWGMWPENQNAVCLQAYRLFVNFGAPPNYLGL